MPILASTNFANGYGKASVVTAGAGALPLESESESQDIFVVKYNTSGKAVWSARIGTTGGDVGYGIASDSNGNVYVTGQFANAPFVISYNSDGTAFGSLVNGGNVDAFIAKYNTNGVGQWIARLSGGNVDIAYGVATDSSGNVYVTGQGSITAYNASGSSFGSITNSSTGTFVVKYNSTGTVQWLAKIDGTGTGTNEIGYAIATDSSGNVYITGTGSALTAFNSNGTASGITIPNAGNSDAFIVKYDTNGFVQWIARIASTGADIGYGIATDSMGNVYVTGQGNGTVTAYNSDGTAFGTTLPNSAFVVKYNSNGFVEWVARIVGTGYGITTDSSGNVYVTGQSTAGGAVTAFNSDGTAFGTTLSNAGSNDVFIVKYNSDGFVQWVARVASTAQDIGYGIVTDSGGNVYVTGQGGADVSLTAFNSDGTAFGTTVSSAGSNDAFLVKYDTNGVVQWLTRLTSPGQDIARSLAIDSDGNLYITGQYTAARFSIYGSALSLFSTLPNAGGTDAFVVKYGTSGDPQWAARIASTGADIGFSIANDSSGNVYVTGQGGIGAVVTAFSSDGVAFGTTLANSGGNDIFIVKYNTNGIVQWVARIGTVSNDIGLGITTDSDGSVYVTGQCFGTGTAFSSNGVAFGTLIGSSGSGDAFIVKYDTNGIVQWVARVGSTGGDIGYGIATDSSGNVYLTGQGGGVVTAFSSNGTAFGTTLAYAGGNDAFLVKYDTSGIVQWVARVASTGADIGYGIATDSSGNVYLTGQGGIGVVLTAFSSNGVAFGTTLANAGAFIVKYNTNGIVQWVARVASTGGDIGYAIATDSGGNVYVTGQGGNGAVVTAFSSNGVAFGTQLVNSGNTDAFVVKYNTNGFVQWVARVASTGADIGYGIATDSSGNVYITCQNSGFGEVTIFNSDMTAFAVTTTSLGIVKYNTNGYAQWFQSISGTTSPVANNRGITVDSNGNAYITGASASGQVTRIYGGGNSGLFRVLNSIGGIDAYVMKQTSNGNVEWLAQIGGVGSDIGYSIAAVSNGDIYVTGGYAAQVRIYNSDGTSFGTTLANAGGNDAFLVKYNTNGFVQWVARVASTGADIGYGITTDPSGNVYVTGQGGIATVTAYNSNGTAFATTLANAGGVDAFIVKYSSSGFVEWVARVASASTTGDIGYQIKTDSSGNVYATGYHGGTTTAFNANGTAFTTTVSNTQSGGGGSTDVFIVKYNTNGFVQWIARAGSAWTGIEYPGGMSVDSGGNIYIAGFQGTNQFYAYNSDGTQFAVSIPNRASGDAFIVKYNTDGFVEWIAQVGDSSAQTGFAVANDLDGNVYVCVRSSGSYVIRNSDATIFTTVTSAGGGIIKYNSSGFAQWVATIVSSADTGYGILTDSAGDIYVTGASGSGTLTIRNADGQPFGSLITKSVASATSFVIKYNSNGVVQWATRTSGQGTEEGRDIALDGFSNIYTTGSFNGGYFIAADA